ncbi:tetratricopeptide repeat protein [Variovorax sp. VRV01]|uniref:tetratricopeptide repeat protein n=1 Tax=Variovorax sp. VRV01 TaxID=2769259 RepID=UPI00298D02C6|nr:tetratricopeptide repeat protein [Variovorax sp. VRV01]
MKSEATAGYTVRRVQQMLGISRAIIDRLVRAGFVSPTRGRRNEHRFEFQDVMLLRTAYDLQRAHIPPRKILRSLQSLRASLPRELPLTGLRISAVGEEVAVRTRDSTWEATSGQMLMDFEVTSNGGELAFIDPRTPDDPATASGQTPEALVNLGASLEATDPAGAEAAYRSALEAAPDFVDAILNLGALLCDSHRCAEAVQLYEQALPTLAASAPVQFNYAIALEDAGQLAAAAQAYARALELDPGLADAHYNLGRLHEQLEDPQAALRHFSAYRRLTREAPAPPGDEDA